MEEGDKADLTPKKCGEEADATPKDCGEDKVDLLTPPKECGEDKVDSAAVPLNDLGDPSTEDVDRERPTTSSRVSIMEEGDKADLTRKEFEEDKVDSAAVPLNDLGGRPPTEIASGKLRWVAEPCRPPTEIASGKLSWVAEPCHHGTDNTPHACHICLPIPEEVVIMLEDSIGLTATEARKAGFTFLRYLREQQHTDRVKMLMKYVSGLEVPKKRSRRHITLPVPHTREQKLRAAIHTVARQKGAWGIFEDEEVVISHLDELNEYLATLDKNSIRKALKEDKNESVKALGIFFALEKRWIVRSKILAVFDSLITKDSTSLKVLVMSDLPVDLAKAIQQEYMDNDGGQERILSYAGILLTLVNSGYSLQVDHLERIDAEFLYCLLKITEGGMRDGCSAVLRDTAVNIILAYNLQFELEEMYTNKVLAALAAFKYSDYFKEKMLLYILNMGVSQFWNKKSAIPLPATYVVKLATDILISYKTADFFIDSDLNILLAGVGSYVSELEPGDENRTLALRLARLILQRLDYQYNGIRRVLHILKRIFLEKDPESRKDRKIARRIAKEIEESRPRYLMTRF